jgi:hypothetical protein
MLTSEDHRQLAERCIRLAKTCTEPGVAEHLMTLAANYLELAERALRLHQSATADLRRTGAEILRHVDLIPQASDKFVGGAAAST